jgi:hypothetical protein
VSIILSTNSTESLRERTAGVRQVRVSLGRDPASKRYSDVRTSVRGGRRVARQAAARLVKEASEDKIPLECETLPAFGALAPAHRGRGRAPKTLLENRRMAARPHCRALANTGYGKYRSHS